MAISDLYTPKQLQVLTKIWIDDFFICGLHGAKRAGKTVVNNDAFISELVRVRQIADKIGVDEPMYILAGTSSTSIQNNILQELYNKYEFEPKYDKHGSFVFKGVKVIQVYTGSISGLKRARGFTAYGAYINEASLANETVFKEIISRCSGEGARIIWDSNPDNPNHWLKKDYIDKPSKNIINFHFRLDDNTFLSDRYRANIKESTPSGMFWDRDIEGLWVIGEGAIYRDFDKDIHYVDDIPWDNIKSYYAGVDWGYEHYGSIVVIGEAFDGKRYVVEVIAKQHEEIDFWVAQAHMLARKYGLKMPFYCDSARPEHVDRLWKEGLKAINANKAVISGIEEVAKGFKTKTLFVLRTVDDRFDEEIFQYAWDEKTGMPVKVFDDVMDALRYGLYTRITIQQGFTV